MSRARKYFERPRRRYGIRALLVALALVATISLVSSSQATPEDQDATALASAVDSLTNRLSSASDALGNYSDLAKSLPLTDLAPGDANGLDLSNLLKNKLGSLAGSYVTFSALASAIEAKDDTAGPLKIQFGAGGLDGSLPAVQANADGITVPILAQRHVDQPLQFTFGSVDMAGGSLGVDFEYRTTLTFHVDSSAITSAATAPPTALSLDPPTMNVCAHATGSVGVFTARFGFTDVKVSTDNPATNGTTETAKLHSCVEVAFQDPDSVGGITMDEWTSYALTELVNHASLVKGTPGPADDLDVTLYADASLVGGDAFATNSAADASVNFNDNDLSSGPGIVTTPNIGAGLQPWLNITAGDVANGLQQFVAGLAGTQNLGGGKLPFLDASLSDIFNTDKFSAVKPLSDYVSQLTSATVGCGTTKGDDTHFPTGFTDNLATGTLVYCRASTTLKKETGSVVWSVPSDASSLVDDACGECGVDGGGSTELTFGAEGASPTKDFVFKMKAPGNFTAKVTWDADPSGATDTKAAIPRPGSAQELFQRLATAAGLDDDVANDLGYDAATKSLTFRLKHDPLQGTATGGSAGAILEDTSANFTDGDDDPIVGQIVRKTNINPVQDCKITVIAQHTLACALSSGSWGSGDTYDIGSPNVDIGADIGDLLRNKTNLAGLADASAGFSAGVNGIKFDLTFGVSLVDSTSDITPLKGTATGGSSANTLEDTSADFTDGDNDPRIGQVVKKTSANPVQQCTITAIGQHTLTCPISGGSWASGDAYDVDGGLADRFYIKTDPSNPEFSVDDLHVTGSASLKGNVGFLGVVAHIGTADHTVGFSKADSSKPVLAIDVKTPGSNAYTVGGTTIPGAIAVSDLLFHLDSAHVGADCNLKANAELGVSATVDGKELASGKVTADWPNVFKTDSCEPDLSALTVDADTNFDENLRNFDPFPSVSGTHDGGTSDNLIDSTKDFTKVGFDPAGQPSPDGGNSLLSLTLTNKTTGASCTITTISQDQLNCTLTGGTRSGDDADKNKWLNGDEYEASGNALAFLSYILDNLDKLADQLDQLSPGLTDKELPLVGISTKELIGKIKSLKQTTDELRGAPNAQVDCTGNADGTNPQGFSLQQVDDNTDLYCRAVTTAKPQDTPPVTWTQFKGTVTIVGPVKSDGTPGDVKDTVGANPTAREHIKVSDGDATLTNDTAISEWQVDVKFTDAAGDHHAEFPTAGAPRSLQELGDQISQMIGVPHVVRFEVLDLPKAGDAPKTMGQADNDNNNGTADNVLSDNSTDFTALATEHKPVVGNLLVNGTDHHYCTITVVATHTLTCAAGSGMEWSNNDEYQVVGDGTKDLVTRLGFGYCSGGGVDCEDTDQQADPLSAPLNFSTDFSDVVGVQSNGTINLDYAVRAHLDFGIPLKLGVPDIAVLDTSGFDLEGNLNAQDIGLSAAIGPLTVSVGKDPNDPNSNGLGKLGAKLSLESDTDTVPDNGTMTFGDFLSNVASNASFDGVSQDCDAPAGGAVEASGDACAVLTLNALGNNFGDLTVECTIGNDPLCDATLPQALKDLINGQGLDWALLIKVLPQILANLQKTLDGAAQDIHIPVIGDALDAGANIVGEFNDHVVTPFADLVDQLKNAADQDGDGDVDAYDLAKLARDFIWTAIGPSAGTPLILDSNGDGQVTKDDVVVTPLCGDPATVCANGDGVPPSSNLIRDFRVTFLLGQGINGDLPFDIGLKGLPLRLQGGVHGGGSWSLLVDFGLSLKDGPYVVANGKKSFTGIEARTGGDTTPRTYLEDNNTDFNGSDNSDPSDDLVEIGMWLQNTSTGDGCRVTKVEEHKLFCTDFGLNSPDDEANSASWNGTDEYGLVARHAPDTPDSDGAAELNLNATVSMAPSADNDNNGQPDACEGDDPSFPAGFEYLNGYDSNRCLKGQIAFLQVIVRDKTGSPGSANATCDNLTKDDPTALMLCASLDFKSDTDRVTFSDLVAGNFSFDPKLGGKVNLNVRLRTGLNTGQSAGFPSILGKFHLFWGFSVSPSQGANVDELDINFDGLTLDAGTFISEFLGPIIKQVKDLTNPLMPVVEMLQGEVPIVSDLSKLVGQGPVTVLDLLEAISGNDLSLMRSILQMIKFVNSLPTDGDLLIGLGSHSPGSFDVSGATASSSPLLPDSTESPFKGTPDAGTDLVDKLGESGSPYEDAKTPPSECDRASTFGVCGLTFPFLGNATQIFGMLMGKDATLVEYDAGTFGAGAGFDFCFPPILIGPVPVQICIGGSFRVDGRFAVGYDTSGLRKVLAGGTGTHLLDGIFLDDYDSKGVDVPEIKFTGTVYAEGAVSVYIFKVGIRGEIIFTAGLNLHEDPPQDGKLRIEEIIAHLFNPLCLFDVEGKIEAALDAFVKIDLFITSVEFSIQIVKITLLEFTLDVCNVKPVLAHYSGDNLVLNMGSSHFAGDRGINTGEINEKFTVRQMEDQTSGPNNGKTRFSVSAFGIQQDYFLDTAKVANGTAKLIADGDDGDDVVSLLAGSASGDAGHPDQEKPPIPFTLRAQITGGTGNDEITTGEGADNVSGNENDDKLTTAGAADTVSGGAGNDQIDAGTGNDTSVHGDGDNDIVNGGPGGDDVFGDGGDDVVSSGPGEDTNNPSVDTLHGGAGNDTLNGDGGGDTLYGDEDLTDCSADGAGGGGNDQMAGGGGNDHMFGSTGNDTLNGFEGDDQMCGGGGNDEMDGAAGNDTMSGGSGDDDMIGGVDTTGDTMNGGADRDYMLGDEGTLSRDQNTNIVVATPTGSSGTGDTMHGDAGRDFMWGQNGTDTMNGDDGNDLMLGGAGNDTMNGNANDDEMYGDDTGDTSQTGTDTMHGNAGNDYMRGGPGTDTMDGDDNNDEMYGDGEVDTMRGGANDDLMRGGGGDDYVEGNGNDSSALPLDNASDPNANVNFDLHLEKQSDGSWTKVGGDDGDVVYGDAGQDDLIGGSSSSAADGGDTILGNVDQDVVAGDNATITRPGGAAEPDGTVKRTITLLDPGGTVGGNSGADWIQGNLGNDDVYAGGDGDLVHGNEGDDYVEGNGGSDGAGVLGGPAVAAIGLYGDTGQDDLIGGTSQGSGGIADGGDDVWGGQGEDVIAGDNASIGRTGGGTCGGFVCNTFRAGDVVGVVIRHIVLFDVATTTTPAPAGTSGADTVDGQDAHDRIYGQGGGDDLKGGQNDDFVFGNAGADTIHGGDGQDDLIGGTGRTDSAVPASATDGRLDDGDVIFGEAGFDAIAGDNSRMVRKTTGADDDHGTWVANTFNAAVDRLIAFMDVGVVGSPAGAGTSGNDQLLGGTEDDVVYGQGGNDGVSGGDGQDILEGNANGSGSAPNPNNAYGDWPTFEGDVIHGDAGADDVAGGTGWIYRIVAGVETGDPIVGSVRVGTDGRLDGGDTIYGDTGGDALAGDNTVIERALTAGGAWILDNLHSPDANGVVRRITRERDVAMVGTPAGAGTSGGDVIYGNDGVDVAYGQGGDDQIQGNAQDDHLEGNAGADTVSGGENHDDVIGGTGRTFSNDESTAADGRIDNQTGNDTLNGGDGAGGVPTGDEDVVIGDNGTIDRLLGDLPAPGNVELGRLPFNGVWGETTWDEPNILRVVRLLDVARTGSTAPETNGTNGADTINGEASNDVLFGEGGNDTISGDDANLFAASPADANPGDDYVEGNDGADTVRGDGNQDDIAGGSSASHSGGVNTLLDANRDGRLDDLRNGETSRDGNDLILGDSSADPNAADAATDASDVVAGDNARIQRKLDGVGDWRNDAQRGARLRDVFLFDIRIVGSAEPGNADPGESGVDSIYGNGGKDILFGQDNGQADTAAGDAWGDETMVGDGANAPAKNCQSPPTAPGTTNLSGTEENPAGDDDNDDLPNLEDPQCRDDSPGDKVLGQGGQDYIEGNSGSDTLSGGEDEDDVIGGSSSNTGHVNATMPPGDRDAGFTPMALTEANKPNNLNDGHDVIEGNAEDDSLLGDNGFVDRYIGSGGAWIVINGGGHGPLAEHEIPNPEPARAADDPTSMVRRDVTTKATKESPGAFGDDLVRGGTGKDDIYGTLGNDWLEGNEGEDAIVGDMGKIVDNLLGPNADELADPSLNVFIAPQQPFLGSTSDVSGELKREVTLYAFDQSQNTAGIGNDVALGGSGNDWIHTGPGEDLANGNAGDDRIFLGDNTATVLANKNPLKLAHDQVDAGWGGAGYDHVWGGYGADYGDVRPRTTAVVPGLTPASDPEAWFEVAGAEPSQNGINYLQDNFDDIDYIYGGWDQDTIQANIGDNGPHIGDRLLDWAGSYNGYYLCPSTYGDWVSTRAIAPSLIEFLQAMAQADGASQTATSGTSGFRETAIVFSNEVKFNTKPIHPDTPAHFTCGPGTTTP